MAKLQILGAAMNCMKQLLYKQCKTLEIGVHF